MIKQTIAFQNKASLSLRNNQMVIQVEGMDSPVYRAIEDIGVVIIENQMVKITIPLLNALVDNNVAVVFCNKDLMPSSMLWSLNANTTLQESYRFQVEASISIKNSVWKQLVESKIKNQARLLNLLDKDGNILKPYYSNVKSGDSDNREGIAARIYWQTVFGKDFIRKRDGDKPNGLLNYGYTILRAATTRAILGSGLFPAFGVFHKSRYNAFPLADDIMEPYRPFVDKIVCKMINNNTLDLTKESKLLLQSVLSCDVKIGKYTHPLESALRLTTASLLKYLKKDISKLVLPELI